MRILRWVQLLLCAGPALASEFLTPSWNQTLPRSIADNAIFAISRRVPTPPIPEVRGLKIYTANCSGCHGSNRSGIVAPRELGSVFARTVRGGRGRMPAFDEVDLSETDLDLLASYLDDHKKGEAAARNPQYALVSTGKVVSAGGLVFLGLKESSSTAATLVTDAAILR